MGIEERLAVIAVAVGFVGFLVPGDDCDDDGGGLGLFQEYAKREHA